MTAATWPREDSLAERLLVVDASSRRLTDSHIAELPSFLEPGDVLVLNDAATAPAALAGQGPSGALEARLAGELEDGLFRAVILGAGDWRQRTEERAAVKVHAGEWLVFGALGAEVVAVEQGRVATLRFEVEGEELWQALYRYGRPIQYSYLQRDLSAWHAQTRYGSRPWAVEAPSAGRPLTLGLLMEIARRGVKVCSLTHAAGLSSTGDPVLDALLPFPERYDIPERTAEAVAVADRVIAVGTTVVRALEGCAAVHRRVLPGEGITDLRLGAGTTLRVVDAILTGMHEPATSHFALLRAFTDGVLLAQAWEHADREGYLAHEFGDSSLIFR